MPGHWHGRTCQQIILVGAMGMPQPLGPEVAPAFCLSCGRPNLIAWWGRRQTCQRQPWWALWVCRNQCRGFTGCSCLLRILPEAQCYSLVMAKHGSYNLGGRYGYAATPGPRGCSCLSSPCRTPNQQQPWWGLWVCRNPWAQGLLLFFA